MSPLEKGIQINEIVSQKIKMYSRNILNSNGINGNGHLHHINPELQKLKYEIDKAEFAVDRAYKELQKAEQEMEYLRIFLYNELGIEDDFYLFNLGFLKDYGLTESLYRIILNYNNKVIEYVTKYKKYVMALYKYETALANYAIRTEGQRAIEQKIREVKVAYREAEIQYANTTIKLRHALNKLLETIKYLIDAEYKFTTIKSKLEKLDILDEHASRLQDKVIEAFYEYQDRLKDYHNARKNVSKKVKEYKEARTIYETIQQEYEEVLRDIMAN
jgi:chromosome segregation ATPase